MITYLDSISSGQLGGNGEVLLALFLNSIIVWPFWMVHASGILTDQVGSEYVNYFSIKVSD